jgi:hypothetical protein
LRARRRRPLCIATTGRGGRYVVVRTFAAVILVRSQASNAPTKLRLLASADRTR